MKGIVAASSTALFGVIAFFFYGLKKNKEAEQVKREAAEARNLAYEKMAEAEAKKQEVAELEIESDLLKSASKAAKDIHNAVLKHAERRASDKEMIDGIKDKTMLSEEEKEVAEELSKDPFADSD